MNTLPRATWQKLENDHELTVGPWLKAFRERRKRRQPHPVQDFLFVYYRYSPTKLQQWHPGIGYSLEDASIEGEMRSRHDHDACRVFSAKAYSRNKAVSRSGAKRNLIFCDPAKITCAQRERMEWSRDMLAHTADRPGNFGCFGLHEWAMVYGGKDIRHDGTTPLRLTQQEIDDVVRELPIACSHFDAFRFFADDAKSLNILQPTVEDRADFEQPACIHANMDLYKWAFKAMPWLGSKLLLDCFYLARDAREIDMRASPYDLSAYGIGEPICIETDEGRADYQVHQRRLADRAKPLRKALVDRLDEILKFLHDETLK